MNMRPVSSSRMREVGWENNTLYIRFNDGALYAYYNVSETEYINFINSSSLGSAFLDLIRYIHTVEYKHRTTNFTD